MGILFAKISIIAALFGMIGLVGLALLFLSTVFLIVRIANFDSVLPALLCILISVGVITAGLGLSPMPDFGAEFARTAENDTPEDKNTSPTAGDEDLGRPGAPEATPDTAPDKEDESSGKENPTGEDGKNTTASSTAEATGILVEKTLDGWRLRLTIPKEWEDICVIEKYDSGISFSQKASMRDYGGHVFSLWVVEGHYDPDSDDAAPASQVVVEKENMSVVAEWPTDVQFNYEVKEISDEYDEMSNAVPGILDTVVFERA